MRYPASETAAKHERILEDATRLFRERGFDGVAIPEIMSSSGLTHGSFYNHFSSKSELMGACVDHGAGRSLGGINAAPATKAGKLAYVKEYLSISHRDDPGSGCLMAALGSEARRTPAALMAMTDFVGSFISELSSHFPWSTKRNARRDAIRTTAALVGGILLARAVNDESLSEEILREVFKGLRDNFSKD